MGVGCQAFCFSGRLQPNGSKRVVVSNIVYMAFWGVLRQFQERPCKTLNPCEQEP